MSQLMHIKQRIKSIRTTHKVTHAMRLISMSLYSKLEKQRSTFELHRNQIDDLFYELLQTYDDWTSPIFFPQDILNTNPLIIVISPVKGFCGSLTVNLSKYIERTMFVEEHQAAEFITIGAKAREWVQQENRGTIIRHIPDINTNTFSAVAQEITDIILHAQSPYSSVTAYSPLLKNFFVQLPQKTELIPFVQKKHEGPAIFSQDENPIWEQDPRAVIQFLANTKIKNGVTRILFQALISEYASRFLTMDSATNNAQKYLDFLTLQFNKMRQGLITKEVSELSANL